MSVFISVPISALSKSELKEIDSVIIDICNKFEELQIYYAGSRYLEMNSEYDPEKEILWDFERIDDADSFVFIFPKSVASSCLIELGYAISKQKNVHILCNQEIQMPFMIKYLPNKYYKTKLVYSNLKKYLYETLCKCT